MSVVKDAPSCCQLSPLFLHPFATDLSVRWESPLSLPILPSTQLFTLALCKSKASGDGGDFLQLLMWEFPNSYLQENRF